MAEPVTLLWGAPDLRDAIGVVQSCGVNTSQENAEARDEQGKVIELRSYSQSDELSIEALITSGKTPPKAGEKVTISAEKGNLAGDYLCTSSNVTQSNTDYQKVSITLQKKDSAAIVPASSPSAGE